jgi:predicted NUDIX family NTP pyrophosphohydrolase
LKWDACILRCLRSTVQCFASCSAAQLGPLALRVNGPSDSARRRVARPHRLSSTVPEPRHKSYACTHPPRGHKTRCVVHLVRAAMARKLSAGIVLYRKRETGIEVLIVHPGGPFWTKKDDGAWSIPKGEYVEEEDPLEVAKREFHEETGMEVRGPCIELPPARQPSGKIIRAWAVEGDLDPASIRSNSFSMEWPPKSGRVQSFPEVDRALWCELPLARTKLIPGQRVLLDGLEERIQ